MASKRKPNGGIEFALASDSDDSDSDDSSSSSSSSSSDGSSDSVTVVPPPAKKKGAAASSSSSSSSSWTCPDCTLDNEGKHAACAVCGAARRPSRKSSSSTSVSTSSSSSSRLSSSNSKKQKSGASASSPSNKRERKTRYFTTADGHTVLKANNYTVVGDRYVFNVDERDYSKHVSASDYANRRKSAPPQKRAPNAKQMELQSHNNAMRKFVDKSIADRRSYFSRHLPSLSPFLDDSVTASLRSDQSKLKMQPDPPEIYMQPEGVTGDMRDYQLAGLNFLARMHKRGCPAILGDEMGLGKTLQTIAFLTYLKETLGEGGPSLIICPLSVIQSWINEFGKWAPALKVLRLHASSPEERERQIDKMKNEWSTYDCVVTTYDMVKTSSMMNFCPRYYFRYVVLDEGHVIKNSETDLAQAVRRIHSHSRLILTGTPLQNNLHELWCLLNYLVPELFTSSDPFDDAFDLAHDKVDKEMLNKAHTVLKLFMLRRMKTEVEKLMPKKTEIQIYCPLSQMQQTWYKGLLLKDVNLLCNIENQTNNNNNNNKEPSLVVEGSSSSSSSSSSVSSTSPASYKMLNNLIMQLRKCCNHPFQFDGAEENIEKTTLTDIIAASGKMAVLDKLLIHLHKTGHRVCLFSQFTYMLDILDDYCNLRGWYYTRLDGGTSRVQRAANVDSFNAPNSKEFLFLMSTRSGGMGLNLQTADTVILYDSDWNPQPDIQAMARVHRIGQTKIVHVYRMVSLGTVEERMIARAQKKLYLDRMVNGGEGRDLNGKLGEDDDDDDDDDTGLTAKDLLDTLKFGSDAVFGKTTNELPTDKEIETITDRTKDPEKPDAAVASGKSGSSSSSAAAAGNGTLKNAQQTVGEFAATMPAFNQSMFGGIDFLAIREQLKADEVREKIRRQMAGLEHKRKITNRVVMVAGKGSGYGGRGGFVPVLAANNYDLEDGESSVFDRELRDRKTDHRAASKVPEKIRASTIEKHHRDCQACGTPGGRGEIMLECKDCPVSMHYDCALAGMPLGSAITKKWQCPHHKCYPCGKGKSAAGGLLYRCQCCVMAYCEECVPKKEDSDRIGRCERFWELGFVDSSGYYINCCADCRKVAKSEFGWVEQHLARRPKTPNPIDVSFAFSNVANEKFEVEAADNDNDDGDDDDVDEVAVPPAGGLNTTLVNLIRRVSPLSNANPNIAAIVEAAVKPPEKNAYGVRKLLDHMAAGGGPS